MQFRLACLLILACALRAETISFGPGAGSKFSFEVGKTGVMNGKKHIFQFAKFSGQLDLNKAAPADSKVSFSIDPKSLQCFDEWSPAKGSIDKILKEALGPVLQVEKYPAIQFQSTRVSVEGADTFQVQGMLTIRGVAKPAVVKVVRKGTEAFEGSSTILMTDYGIKPPTAAFGAVGTKPEIVVSFVLAPAK